ncbi:exported hypothetical protein [Agrobacterium tomkonis CFBP 6623]|uniref:Uncharacterized protein n=1 Tax=Agrobacterium tomkonis CFBP 6623 TaxID=1183432 RepID=A0A1S7PUA9_9HYPH|nr:exported hypothetical protein [Agrobacterium tomkonis CFBP 6623]
MLRGLLMGGVAGAFHRLLAGLARGCAGLLSLHRPGRTGGGKFGETVERLVFQQPVDTRIRMEMQEGGKFGRGKVVGGDHGRKLSHVPRPGNP